jgi:hypothetical protein
VWPWRVRPWRWDRRQRRKRQLARCKLTSRAWPQANRCKRPTLARWRKWCEQGGMHPYIVKWLLLLCLELIRWPARLQPGMATCNTRCR